MVFSSESEKERLPKLMAMGTEESKLLHKFTHPLLKWGAKKHLRCTNVNSTGETVSGADCFASTSKLDNSFATARRKSKSKRKKSKSGIEGSGDLDREDGIEAIGKKLMFDLEATAEKLRNARLTEEIVEEVAKEKGDEAETGTPAPAIVEEKPWNLRTRRGASKGRMDNAGGIKAAPKTDERKSSQKSKASNEGDGKSPRPRAGIEKLEMPKFSISLSKKEIEEDFLAMTGSRPPRRPRKRPKAVQKQMDVLFPGTWLSDITPDSYKVSEN